MRQALFSRKMKKLSASAAALWLCACAPDLSANEAARCDEQQLCETGEYCYRGFCLPQDITPVIVDDAGQISDPLNLLDGATLTTPSDAAVSAELDAGSTIDAAAAADASVATDAAPPANNKPDAAPPGNNRPDAGPPGNNRPDAAVVVDASVRADASTTCTNKECCDEAKRFANGDDEDGKGRGKKCGCDNLLQVIACGLFSGAQTAAPPIPQGLP